MKQLTDHLDLTILDQKSNQNISIQKEVSNETLKSSSFLSNVSLFDTGKIYEVFSDKNLKDELRTQLFSEILSQEKSVIYFYPKNLKFFQTEDLEILQNVISFEYESLLDLFEFIYSIILNSYGDCICIDNLEVFNLTVETNDLRFINKRMKATKSFMKVMKSNLSLYFLTQKRIDAKNQSTSIPSMIANYDHRFYFEQSRFNCLN